MTTRTLTRLFVLSVGLALAATATADDKKPEKPKSIKEIMKKGHAGKKALLSVIAADLKAGEWDKVAKATEVMKVYGETLGEFDPPKGEKDSWKALAEKYKADTKALDDAAKTKDAAATEKAQKTLAAPTYCKSCHSSHK
jgi:cytochrome c556